VIDHVTSDVITSQGRCDSSQTHADRSHYRAPELLFGPLRYDAQAIDMWALGVILAEFFTPRKGDPQSSEESDEDPDSTDESDDDDDLLDAPRPTRTPDRHSDDTSLEPLSTVPGSTTEARSQSERQPLFDCAFGDLGLAASIFRLLGTPTVESWPVSRSLLAS
jgi:serine/threonine protein kinase